MKIKLLSIILVLVACNVPSASAATVTEKIVIGGKTVFTFTIVDSLTLDPKGCKDVYIKYTMDKSYSYPNAFVMFMYKLETAKAPKEKMLGLAIRKWFFAEKQNLM